MYERNAIVLERYFSKLFGYDEKNNLKNNYANYIQLVEEIEKYQEATRDEDNVITEYDQIINKIKEIQKNQDLLYRKNEKLQESRKSIFENIDENVDGLKRKLDKLDEEIQQNSEEMKVNGENYILELTQFNEISLKRNQCSRNRRIVEENYQTQLRKTIENINGINVDKVNEVKNFFKSENNIQEEIQNKVMKNGEKEKIPFDLNVIEKSIDIQTDIEEQETEIFCSVYDKTHRLLVEIKNNTIKLEKHKKLIRDSECKINFLNAMKEYLTLFLDNERLNIVGGEKEHKKLMTEACENLEKDFVEIKNLYTLLTKEISGKVTKKMYKDLYHSEYLYDLEEQEKEFERNISRLNVIGTVIYPDYWRIDGMQKILESFRESVKNVYGRDLSEYEPITLYNKMVEYEDSGEENNQDEESYDDIDYEDFDDEDEESEEQEDTQDEEDDEVEESESEEDIEQEETNNEKEKDKEIDEILGFYNFDTDITEDEDDDEVDEDISDDEIDEENEEDFEIDDESEDYEYGFDEEDDGYDNIDFDDDEDDESDNEPKISFEGKKK